MSHLRIVRGDPTDAELAALVAALAVVRQRQAAAAAGAESSRAPVNAWADPAARLRRALHPGPQAWVHSALPH